MPRQRVRLQRFAFADALLRVVTVLVGLALIFYGVMAVLLALKLSPHTVNDISAYRTIYDHLASLDARSITGRVRVIVAAAGVVSFLLCAVLTWRALPRPYLTRSELDLPDDGHRGSTVVSARAIERAGELAALAHPLVLSAAGRYGTESVSVALTVRQPGALADTLTAVQQRVSAALAEHELPQLPVNVTLTGVESANRRELA